MTEADARGGRDSFTLEGWQTEPQLHWSFQHISEIFPTARIRRAEVASLLPAEEVDLRHLPLVHPTTGAATTIGAVMAGTDTDGWIVTRNGRICQEAYLAGMRPETRHLLMSVSKSIIGIVTGRLVDDGLLNVELPVEHYVSALKGTGYAGATVRHLLDMRSGIRFSEEYLDPNAEVRLLEQAIGWAPRKAPGIPNSLYEFLATLQRIRPHGGPFEYRSCETDVLGWVCEEVAGNPMARVLSDLVWQPIGAEFDADISVDREGAGMFDGGISAALRDLVKFGSIFLNDGVAFSGAKIVSPAWVQDTLTGGPDSAAAFAASKDAVWMPGGMYRNQMWFPTARRDMLLCLGIHGQMIYVNRAAGVVAAKLSSWPTPQDANKLLATIAAFDAVSTALSAPASA